MRLNWLGVAAVILLGTNLPAWGDHGSGTSATQKKELEKAHSLQQKGSLREARKAYQSLLPQLSGSERAAALLGLSQIANSQGEYDAAISVAAEAADAYRALGDRAGEIRALNSSGAGRIYRGDYAAALRDFEECLSLAHASGDGEAEIEALNNIGSAHYLQAGYLEALRAYREAIDRIQAAGAQRWSARRRRITDANLAMLHQRLGQNEQALELYAEMAKAPEALGPSEQARLLINRGVLYRHLHDPLKALRTYQEAQRLLQREQHQDAQVSVLKTIGIVHALDLGDLPAALQAFSRALELAEKTHDRREAMQVRLYRGETLLRRGDARAAETDFDAALALARELHAPDDEWKALYGLGRLARARGDGEAAARQYRAAIVAIESMRARLQLPALKTDFLADKRLVYDALIELMLQRPDAASVFDLLERSRARNFQDRFATAALTLAAVQARLDPAAMLLEYWVGPGPAAALWVTRDGAGLVPVSFSGDELASFLDEVSSGDGEGWRRRSTVLGGRLLPPIGAEVRRLIVVPDGPLGELPFELLGAGGALTLEKYEISYLPSAAILLRDLPLPRRWAFPWAPQLVAFADPRVSPALPRTASDLLGGAELRTPLPASADEARAIARICRGRAQLYLAEADLKRHFLQVRAPLLHLSTHAIADGISSERSRILFSPGDPGERADYLFLKEVYDLDLRGVELVTLSACDTERGKIVRGEGLQGFGRALLAAGSRTAVTALWRVADQPTSELMKQFYFELNRGETKAQALRMAKLRFLRSGTSLAHPRFWAAFILSGEGWRPIPRVIPWSMFLGAGGVLAFAAALTVRRAFRRAAAARHAGRSAI